MIHFKIKPMVRRRISLLDAKSKDKVLNLRTITIIFYYSHSIKHIRAENSSGLRSSPSSERFPRPHVSREYDHFQGFWFPRTCSVPRNVIFINSYVCSVAQNRGILIRTISISTRKRSGENKMNLVRYNITRKFQTTWYK